MEVLPISRFSYSSVSNDLHYDPSPILDDDDIAAAVSILSKRLEAELRSAKRSHLACGEVLLPCGLLQEIARDILELADSEPYGLRGCTLYLSFEGEGECRRLSALKCDPYTTSTFELYLTLKQSTAGWNSFLPQFLKKITRGGTVMVSSNYELSKKKLYRSFSD